jgi:hypothetical protein
MIRIHKSYRNEGPRHLETSFRRWRPAFGGRWIARRPARPPVSAGSHRRRGRRRPVLLPLAWCLALSIAGHTARSCRDSWHRMCRVRLDTEKIPKNCCNHGTRSAHLGSQKDCSIDQSRSRGPEVQFDFGAFASPHVVVVRTVLTDADPPGSGSTRSWRS